MSEDLMRCTPQEFVTYLKSHGIRRFYFVYDAERKQLVASHAELQGMAEAMQANKRDFMEHEGIFCHVTKKFDVLQGAFIHWTYRGQAQGGTRFWTYDTVEDFMRDGLRLSRGMTRKIALADLWWGGGKGVIAQNPAIDVHDPVVRARIFQEYGELVTSLCGCYVTAEDVGTNTEDMANIFSRTRFTTCIPESLGGSGNPSIATARGVVRGMEGAVLFYDGGTLKGKTVAVQGLGNVGEPLVRFLFEKRVGRVIGCDISDERVARLRKEMAGMPFEARVVARGDNSILAEACDIVAPCATGAVLKPDTIPRIQAKIICGGANNQLEDTDRDGRHLFERGILYVPDFLVNRMGIVHCANEQYGYVDHDEFIERHLGTEWENSVYQMTIKVLTRSRESGESPGQAAVRLADKLARREHPIFGHRGRQIIQSLVARRWHEQV